ncbi:hypothetical protein [Silvibacterium dinghuense]|uniref:Uncharacterized protein n=1 Tax=Silvibacterium dinghuense TaxID=1560006 RepID=A0A4Q1SD04_9BACT|nr:hypothetical protein [Silvibacterium dinghuense]RXS95102.1 hypothetical protein ESZ00_10820 [Silvibacterium dinghuense]GGH10609.1 hypothetical protein GCM10011586_29040 [Silvibacterium dinghuense]
MEIASHSLWTIIHGMGFGALYLLAVTGLLVEFHHRFIARTGSVMLANGSFLKWYLIAMSLCSWLAVLTGTYIVYPWYRATPPAGTTDLTAFPQKLLMSGASTAGWHSLGMEWKEHIAWLFPIAVTMAAGVVIRYGQDLRNHPRLRFAVLGAVLFSFASAGIAGFWGAMINKYAPISGGTTITLMKGEAH